jgi:Flp pilus assembly protein TadD
MLDPIVRIEATRLRTALAQYYDTHPEDASVRIDLPKGRYVPIFSKICSRRAQTSINLLRQITGVDGLLRDGGEALSESRWTSRLIGAIVAVTLLATGTVAGGLWLSNVQPWKRLPLTDKPTVIIDMTMVGSADDPKAQAISDAIMVGVSQFQAFRVAPNNRDRPVTYASVITGSTIAADRMHPYRVTLKYSQEDGEQAVWWQVVDDVTGEILRSGIEMVLQGPQVGTTPEQELARKVAIRLASGYGVLSDLETAREFASPSLGNGCVLRAFAALQGGNSQGQAQVRDCLKATLAITPNDADANAVLSMSLVNDAPEEALRLANKAVMLAPSSDRAKIAQSIALFRSAKVDAAITAGYRAMALNPANSSIVAKVGWMLFLSGKWSEGAGLAIRSGLLDTYPHHEAAMTLALDAYRTGQYDEALLRVRQMDDLDDPIVGLLLAATLGEQGDSDGAAAAVKSIADRRSDFEASFRPDLQALQYSPVLIDALQAGLVKAGARFP